MPSYEEEISEFDRLHAQVLGISVDNVPSTEAWAKSLGGLSYPLLSDFWPQGMVALKYNCLRDSGTSERAMFVVDKQGKLAYIDIHASTSSLQRTRCSKRCASSARIYFRWR